MDRDVLLAALIVLVCGPVAWAGPSVLHWRAADEIACERRAWRAVTMPLLAAAAAIALLVGWALREPDATDERLAAAAWPVIGVTLAIWLRAVVRLVAGNLRHSQVAIGVVGLIRPRIVVDPRIAAALDEAALAAALAHEEAHRRHGDPLRIAVAQLASDLQWPWPHARRRLRGWLDVLEQARDDEAVMAGTDPADLAAAIVEVARCHTHRAGAALTGGSAVERRVARLLSDVPLAARVAGARRGWLPVAALLFGALVIGVLVGDDLLGLLPGVRR